MVGNAGQFALMGLEDRKRRDSFPFSTPSLCQF